jgi:8-oxo-dGTP pyrophosphatase MutT (NUDIX family)
MSKPRSISTAIPYRVIQKNGQKQLQFYIHTRFKPVISPFYSDKYEFPVGGIDLGESGFDAAIRELVEETGLKVDPSFLAKNTANMMQIESRGDVILGSVPFYFVEMVNTEEGMLWSGPAYLVKIDANCKIKINLDEAKNPLWLTIDELNNIFAKERILQTQNSFELKVLSNFFELHIPLAYFLIQKLQNPEFVKSLLKS